MGAQLTSLLGRPGALAIVAALGLYAAARSRRKARARRRKKEERGGAAEKGGGNEASRAKKKRRRRPKDALQKLFRRLWPFGGGSASSSSSPDGTAGRLELFSIFAVSVMRTWHVNRMVYVKRDLMLATYKRNLDLFRRVIVETVLMSMASSLIYATHRYLKERLSLIWREKLTKQLHRKYFTRMNYYRLSHLNRGEIADVEERMVKDPRRFCKSLAEEMEKASAAVTSGVWFTYKLTTISSLPFALAPLAYFYCSWKAALLFAPNWSVKWRKMLDLRSKYFSTQGRLQTHAEAVCAYQGNGVERNIIETAWNNFMDYCVLFMRDATLFEFVSSAFFVYGSHTMAATLILSRYISPDGSQAKRNYMKALRDMPSIGGGGGGGDAASDAARRRGYNNASALLFSEIRYLTEYFIRAMSAQGVIIQVLRQLMQMQGPAGRLAELFDTLDKFDAETEASTQFEEDGDKIAFRNVQVYTPTDVMLLKDLNFSLQRGMNLLLTGCNGSGKSSIFRCLGGLWKIPEGGVITKPGGNSTGLNNAVFYLPQKPYNVLGTLRAQLLYPESKDGAQEISDTYLRELLDAVDLGYLMERGPQGPDDDREVDWESVLSMGEKQRLAMARLFYHQPSYAILDECTSGVSASMERRLYESCAARNITCITISHRPVLEQYHDVVLNVLKDGLGGWDFRMTKRGRERKAEGSMVFDADMERVAADEAHRSALGSGRASERVANGKASSSVLSPTIVGDGYSEVGGVSKAYLAEGSAGASTHQGQLERQRLERRSEKYRALAAGGKKSTADVSADPGSATTLTTTSSNRDDERGGGGGGSLPARRSVPIFQRMKDVWDRGFMPDGMSLRDPEARRILLLASMVIAKTLAADSIAFFDGYILTTVLQNDFTVFLKASLTGAVMRTSLAFFDAAITRQKWYLNLAWRKRLTSYLLSKYFSYNTFYDVKNQDDRISDPEERFTEQVEQLSVSLTDLWTNLLKPGFDISFNLVMLYRTLGNTAVGGMAAYMLSAAALLRFIVPNFRQNVRKQYKLEGRFRFVHTRLSVHTESVAFFGGDDVEHEVCNNRLDELKGHIEKTQLQSLRFNIFNNFMVRQTPDLAAFTLRMYYAMAASAAAGADIASTGEYIQQTVMRTFKSFGDAFELQETIGNFIGTLENVSDLMYTLEDLAAKQVSVQSDNSLATKLGRSADGSIEFKGVDIVAPGGTCCASDLSFKVEAGKPLIVTGPNASGKSSLFRMIGGLWKVQAGSIDRPCDENTNRLTPEHVFLVPQKPYSVRGSLADQITYPKKVAPEDRTPEMEAQLFDMLKLVQVEYLVDRYATKDEATGRVLASGWNATMKWEDVLSLGEQQRIGCARLFYINPSFAILDECTSAVSVDVEEELYRHAHAQGITSITISQRLALEEFHSQELKLGDAEGEKGWGLRAI